MHNGTLFYPSPYFCVGACHYHHAFRGVSIIPFAGSTVSRSCAADYFHSGNLFGRVRKHDRRNGHAGFGTEHHRG